MRCCNTAANFHDWSSVKCMRCIDVNSIMKYMVYRNEVSKAIGLPRNYIYGIKCQKYERSYKSLEGRDEKGRRMENKNFKKKSNLRLNPSLACIATTLQWSVHIAVLYLF